MTQTEPTAEERSFTEFRRMTREARLLSAATEKLLRHLHFSGRLSVIVKNGKHFEVRIRRGLFHPPTRRADDTLTSDRPELRASKNPHSYYRCALCSGRLPSCT